MKTALPTALPSAPCSLRLALCALLSAPCLLTSCSMMFSENDLAKQRQRDLVILVGTDANKIETPQGMKAEGINNSNTVDTVKKGIVTKALIGPAAAAIQPLSNGAGEAIGSISQQ